jgi:hypothetical protein
MGFLQTSYYLRISTQRVNTALHLAPRLLLLMMVPVGLIFFGTFFAAVTKERRQKNRTQRPIRAVLGLFEQDHEAPRSRYAYAIEQQEREPLVYQQVRPIYFRGRKLTQPGQ